MEPNFNNYEIIRYEDYPKTTQWALTPIYKINQKGSKMYWQIGYNPYENKLISLSRQLENAKGQIGKLRVSKLDVKTNKSGRNIYDQALLKARSKYHKKYQENFRPENEMQSLFLPAQLAKEYVPPTNYATGEGSNITLRHLERGIACQAKVDGIRARSWFFTGRIPMTVVSQSDTGGTPSTEHHITMLSRNNNEFDSPSHIKEDLKSFFVFLYQEIINRGYNPYGEYDQLMGTYDTKTQWGIDGELYNHNISFEETTSIVRSENTIHPRISEIQYYIFDLIVPNVPSDYRSQILEETYKKYTATSYYRGNITVLSTLIAHSYTDIDNYLEYFISLGYEGVILRKRLGLISNREISLTSIQNLTTKEIAETYYKPERNDNLLKYKLSFTEEGIVIDLVPGEGKEADIAEIILRDIRGNVFRIHPSGSYDMRRQWLLNKSNYIGLPYTFKYGELTEYGVPRFPVGIAFRTYE